MMAAMTAILVTGGTGRLGRAVVGRLLAAGHEVRVLSRHGRGADLPPGGESRAVDLRTDRAGTRAAVADVATIVHCASSSRGDVEAAGNLIEAARAARRPTLVYVSIVGVERVPLGYYRTKLEVERMVEGSGLPWTILRSTQFHDLVAGIFAVQRWSPVIIAPAGVRFQPVDVGEVADRLVALAAAEPTGRAPDMGGPQVRPARYLARCYLRAVDHRRRVLPVHLPGRLGAALREGGNLAPERATGRITFEEYLAQRSR